jgi:hypothetical protein
VIAPFSKKTTRRLPRASRSARRRPGTRLPTRCGGVVVASGRTRPAALLARVRPVRRRTAPRCRHRRRGRVDRASAGGRNRLIRGRGPERRAHRDDRHDRWLLGHVAAARLGRRRPRRRRRRGRCDRGGRRQRGRGHDRPARAPRRAPHGRRARIRRSAHPAAAAPGRPGRAAGGAGPGACACSARAAARAGAASGRCPAGRRDGSAGVSAASGRRVRALAGASAAARRRTGAAAAGGDRAAGRSGDRPGAHALACRGEPSADGERPGRPCGAARRAVARRRVDTSHPGAVARARAGGGRPPPLRRRGPPGAATWPGDTLARRNARRSGRERGSAGRAPGSSRAARTGAEARIRRGRGCPPARRRRRRVGPPAGRAASSNGRRGSRRRRRGSPFVARARPVRVRRRGCTAPQNTPGGRDPRSYHAIPRQPTRSGVLA